MLLTIIAQKRHGMMTEFAMKYLPPYMVKLVSGRASPTDLLFRKTHREGIWKPNLLLRMTPAKEKNLEL